MKKIDNNIIMASLAVAIIFSLGYTDKTPLEISAVFVVGEEGQSAFDNLEIEAKAAYVLDIATGEVLYEKNADAQLPLASLTKMMTALVASALVPDGVSVTVGGNAFIPDGDSGFIEGEKWNFRDIVDFTLMTSSNDGAVALASAAAGFAETKEGQTFVDKMNEKAKNLGLSQTYFSNETGLDIGKRFSGAYGSARDAATLAASILKEKPRLFEATTYEKMSFSSLSGIDHRAGNTNERVGDIAGLLLSKTGFTDLAGGNLAVVFDAGVGRPVAIAVLGSSLQGRFSDVKALYKASLDQFSL